MWFNPEKVLTCSAALVKHEFQISVAALENLLLMWGSLDQTHWFQDQILYHFKPGLMDLCQVEYCETSQDGLRMPGSLGIDTYLQGMLGSSL